MSYRVLATDINMSQCIDAKEILQKNDCELDVEDLNLLQNYLKDEEIK